MSRKARYAAVAGAIASPLLLLGILPLIGAPIERGPLLGGFLLVLAWVAAVLAGRAAARSADEPTPRRHLSEAGRFGVVAVLIVLALLAYRW